VQRTPAGQRRALAFFVGMATGTAGGTEQIFTLWRAGIGGAGRRCRDGQPQHRRRVALSQHVSGPTGLASVVFLAEILVAGLAAFADVLEAGGDSLLVAALNRLGEDLDLGLGIIRPFLKIRPF